MATALERPTLREVLSPSRRVRVISAEDVRILERWRPNVLFTGDSEKTARAFDELSPFLRAPIVRWRPAAGRMLPARDATKTLIVTEPALMSPDEQSLLLQWMRRDGFAQVITMSAVPLFELVASGGFSDSLYYLLNVVHIAVDL